MSTIDEELEAIRVALSKASLHEAETARTTPHPMHVDDHRRKSLALAEAASAVEHLRLAHGPALEFAGSQPEAVSDG